MSRYSKNSQLRKHSRLRRRLQIESLESRRVLATFAVNSVLDHNDGNAEDGICDTGSNRPDTDPPFIKTGICTLAAALTQADHDSGRDLITFDEIGGGDSPVIPGGRALSVLHPVTIDGTTHASGRVGIEGSLNVFDGAIVKGLAIFGHDAALTIGGVGSVITNTYVGFDTSGIDGATDDSGYINIQGNDNIIGGTSEEERNLIGGGLNINGNENRVIGNYVGIDMTGDTVSPAPGVIYVAGGANSIGGVEEGQGNVLAGGIVSDGNQLTVQGNYIGTNAAGTEAINPGGGLFGVSVRMGSDVKIGGEEELAENVISGMGLGVFVGTAASDVKIWGNKIGTNAEGDAAIPNSEAGVRIGTAIISSTVSQVQIGGDSPTKGNIISGNAKGIRLLSVDPEDLVIQNNWIGVAEDGLSAIPNEIGVSVENSRNLIVGGEHGNVISGNTAGVVLGGTATKQVHVLGNLIGLTPSGSSDLGNISGVRILNGASENSIGGPLPSDPSGPYFGNTISGSDADIPQSLWGVGVWVIQSDNNLIRGNRIGTDASGSADIGNEGEGILVFESKNTIVGGTDPDSGNVISGNGTGVLLWSANETRPVTGTILQGNTIGTNAAGTTAIPNDSWGVHLTGYVTENEIGGNTEASGNLISGNSMDGVLFFGPETNNNAIHGNFIGTNHDGTAAIPNARAGVLIEESPQNNIGLRESATFARNVISGNTGPGVIVVGQGATENVFEANIVGLNAVGDAALPNQVGISLEGASETTIGGTNSGDANYISGNRENGLVVEGQIATENIVLQNYIGLNLRGDAAIGNGANGIFVDDAPNNEFGKLIDTTLFGNYVGGNAESGIVVTGENATEKRISSKITLAWRRQAIKPLETKSTGFISSVHPTI